MISNLLLAVENGDYAFVLGSCTWIVNALNL